MDFDGYLDRAWTRHGDDPEGVFERLPEGRARCTTPRDVAAWGALVAHVAGEHLGRWSEGMALLDEASRSQLLVDHPEVADALQRSRAALLLASGDPAGAETILAAHIDPARPPASSRARMLASASTARLGQGDVGGATSAFQGAIDAVQYGPAADDPAARSLAIAGNNLAMELEGLAVRDSAQTELMLLAARTAHRWWKVAGTPTNVLLAEVRLASSLLAAGDSAAALTHASTACRMAEDPEVLAGYRLQALLVSGRAQADCGDLVAARGTAEAARRTLEDVPPQYHDYYGPQVDALDAAII